MTIHGKTKQIFITTADLRYVKSHSDEAHTLASTSAIGFK